MTLFQFIQFFLLFMAMGSLAVSGWFFSTRGWKEIMPDGTVVKEGKIFKGWYFYWTQPMRNRIDGKELKRKIYFDGEELNKFLVTVRKNFPELTVVRTLNSFSVHPYSDQTLNTLTEICKNFDVNILVKETNVFCPFKTFDTYRFPEWVRMPLAQCATCFASVYGSIFYWCIIPFVYKNVFAWVGYPIAAMIFFWIIFCFSLAVLNTALAKKFN